LSDIQIKFTLTPEEPEEEPLSLEKQPPPENQNCDSRATVTEERLAINAKKT
jgi:hypothetical protein